jgi:hypothetical protein
MLNTTERAYFESLCWEKINPIRERHDAELRKINGTRGMGNSPAPYTHEIRRFKKELAEAHIKAYIETYQRIGRYPAESEFEEFADELFRIVDNKGNNLPRNFKGALSPFPLQLVERIEEQLSEEIRQDAAIALSTLHHFINEGKLVASQQPQLNRQVEPFTPDERFNEFQEHTGKQYVSLSDLDWNVTRAFLERIPTELERVDFLMGLTKLPDDGVRDGIIVNPALHRRNQEAFLAPLQKERSRLLSHYFNLEIVLHQAEQIADDGVALAYLWSVLRDYTKYHPTIRHGAYSPDELAFSNAIKTEIQHRKDLLSASVASKQTHVTIGEITMRDSYRAGQVGAMGPNAQAYDMTFNQIWNQFQGKVDLAELAKELFKLRQEMRKDAVEPEHDLAIADIAKAEQAAKAGDGSKTIEHLKSAGKWALDTATKIGTSLAVEVLKEATGLK